MTSAGDMDRRDFLQLGAWGIGAGLLGRTLPEPRLRGPANDLTLGNDAVGCVWSAEEGRLRAVRFEDRRSGRSVDLEGDIFSVSLADDTVLRSSDFRLAHGPVTSAIGAEPRASRFSERLPGNEIRAILADPAGRLRATWRAVLRRGSRYIRQEIQLDAVGGELPVREVALLDLAVPGAAVAGSVRGSPVVAGSLFLGLEDPLGQSEAGNGRVRCTLARELPLRPGVPLSVSAVIGAVAAGQRRREFLEYVERERAHPYRTFLHYNSWYDIGYGNEYDQSQAIDAIDAFGRELHQQRGVTLDSYLFDDGWDDRRTLWAFNDGFPHGFVPLRRSAERWGAEPGVWLSPWGGYGKARQERLAYGRQQGFETNQGGFELSGPKYYARFRDVCLDFIRTAGVNQFKFDGTGNVNSAVPGSPFGSDFEAMIHLIGELRRAKPDLYVNLTTGTWPSPFWLRHADSIWRGGEDHSFAGVGSWRQQWITYRDADTHAGIVQKGPLFPLNSLMLHGLIYAKSAEHLSDDPGGDFEPEVRSYFGTGTQLQEMYITHALLGTSDWDVLAECARWSRKNAGVLRDTHWVGGDPGKLEPYGWAAWSPTLGILTLRNPSDQPKSLALDPGMALELPEGASGTYAARSPWQRDMGKGMPLRLVAGTTHEFALAPFEVVTLELTPAE
jgi:hypothetical protein